MASEQLLTNGDVFVGRYKIEEMVGTGGFSQVFRASNEGGQTVAVKVLLPQEKDGKRSYPDSLVERFVREARLLERLRDPFTIDLYDHGRAPAGHLYMVFEYLQGRELFDIIKNEGQQPHERVAHVLRQTLRGLQSAHALGILHRDIKPNNIMLVREPDGKERVKVLDFGIAKMYGEAADAAGNNLTAAGVLVGTPRYMSPEQLRAGQLGPASDIYSLGIVAIEMLTGRKAIRGKDRIDIIQKQLSPTKFEIPPEISCPADLRNVILRMVEKNVHARYQSAAQVLRELDAWQVQATEGRTIVEVVSTAELHAPKAETAPADEDTNVHRISVASLDAIQKAAPPPPVENDATIAESQIETHSQPSLQARMQQYTNASSDTFNRVDTGHGQHPPQTDMSDLDATRAISATDPDATATHSPLQAAAQLGADAMETVESSAFRRAPASTSSSGLNWPAPNPDDMEATVEQASMSREQLIAAAEERRRSAVDQSAFDLATTSPRVSTDLNADSTQGNIAGSAAKLTSNELGSILVSLLLPGIGHLILGQTKKGIAIFAALILTVGLLYLVAFGVAFDAFLVVRARRKREVGPWEFFPGFDELLS